MVYNRMNNCWTFVSESQFDSPSGPLEHAFERLQFLWKAYTLRWIHLKLDQKLKNYSGIACIGIMFNGLSCFLRLPAECRSIS